jgi:hypothetical protein
MSVGVLFGVATNPHTKHTGPWKEAVAILVSLILVLLIAGGYLSYPEDKGSRQGLQPAQVSRKLKVGLAGVLSLTVVIVALLIVVIVNTHDHRPIPLWVRWALSLAFWGTLLSWIWGLIRRRRNRRG